MTKQAGIPAHWYMSSFEKFKEQSPYQVLYFVDRLKNSDKEYENALKVWDRFLMKRIKDYHNLCLKCDILLLADVFEKFRNSSLKNHQLCPSYYLSAP